MIAADPKPARSALASLRVKLFADGADISEMREMAAQSFISGFTTNPTLMRKAGVTDYAAFARQVLAQIPDRPISFEVFSDDFAEMERQARTIAAWGSNVYVKIPVTNTRGESAAPLVRLLSAEGIKLNVTALMTLEQVSEIAEALGGATSAYVSIFAGRIADTGRDPVPHMKAAVDLLARRPRLQLIWASPREVLNVFQADEVGCHVITATNDILKKVSGIGKDLTQFSLETVKMFHDDARAAGFVI